MSNPRGNHSSGALKQMDSRLRNQLKAPGKTCPYCTRLLVRVKFPKWPNQYDRSRWAKALACSRHGPIERIWGEKE